MIRRLNRKVRREDRTACSKEKREQLQERRGDRPKKERRGDRVAYSNERRGDRALARVMRRSNGEREMRRSNRLFKREKR